MIIDKFVGRLESIGIKVELSGNFPWVYLEKVNGIPVTETYMAEHGFTAFFLPVRADRSVAFSNRKKVFQMVRKMVGAPETLKKSAPTVWPEIYNDCQDEF